MLNPVLPDEIASKEIPTQSFAGVKELFAFRKFQGIVLVRRLHHFAQALNVIWAVLFLLASFRRGVVQIIVSLITFPILLVFFACIIRALSEIAISVLLVPSLLVKSAGVSGRGAVNSRDEDLAAYGVTTPGDAGTIV
ncbi:unnamed protein product [Pylaiella littoralis]